MDYNYNVAGSYNFNNNTFLASIDRDGNIIHESSNGRKKIGVDTQTAEEMQGVIDNYYNKLVELGVFVKEKTAEEIAQEQAEINQVLLQEIRSLNSKVEELSLNGNVRDDNSETSTNVGQVGTRSKTSNSPSKKNDARKSE